MTLGQQSGSMSGPPRVTGTLKGTWTRAVPWTRCRLLGSDQPVTAVEEMSPDLFTTSCQAAASWSHEGGKFRARWQKHYTMQQVMNLRNG